MTFKFSPNADGSQYPLAHFRTLSEEKKEQFVQFMFDEVQMNVLFAMETYRYLVDGRDEMALDNFRRFFDLYKIHQDEIDEFLSESQVENNDEAEEEEEVD